MIQNAIMLRYETGEIIAHQSLSPESPEPGATLNGSARRYRRYSRQIGEAGAL